jgi:N-acetylmuramic acid 6-phosphate etherase
MRTEHISPRYIELDSWSTADMIAAMYEGQLAAAAAVRGALGVIAAAVDDAVPALQQGGRIVYVGAGSSGRIGVQDGAELPPTYNWPADRLVFAMAGGLDALVRSTERAEDDEDAGAQAMVEANVGTNDVVIGIAASGTTPFTIGALRVANAAGALTIAIANNAGAPVFDVARHRILADTGTEVVAGSTRRAEAMVGEILGCPQENAARYLEQADGDVKTAILIGLGRGRNEATELLQRYGGNLRTAINVSKGQNG